MKRMEFEVTTRVVVIIDESKLQPLMADFNQGISDFGEGDDAILQHGEHIARLTAVGEDFWPSDFVEGYGVVKDAGIDVTVMNEVQVERIPSFSEMAGA